MQYDHHRGHCGILKLTWSQLVPQCLDTFIVLEDARTAVMKKVNELNFFSERVHL